GSGEPWTREVVQGTRAGRSSGKDRCGPINPTGAASTAARRVGTSCLFMVQSYGKGRGGLSSAFAAGTRGDPGADGFLVAGRQLPLARGHSAGGDTLVKRTVIGPARRDARAIV